MRTSKRKISETYRYQKSWSIVCYHWALRNVLQKKEMQMAIRVTIVNAKDTHFHEHCQILKLMSCLNRSVFLISLVILKVKKHSRKLRHVRHQIGYSFTFYSNWGQTGAGS